MVHISILMETIGISVMVSIGLLLFFNRVLKVKTGNKLLWSCDNCETTHLIETIYCFHIFSGSGLKRQSVRFLEFYKRKPFLMTLL